MAIAFRLFGIPVRVHAWFFLIGLVLWPMGTEPRFEQLPVWFAIMFTGVLLHELGHAFMARRFGMAPRIELQGLGGLTWWKPDKNLSASRRLLVSAAGPAVGISLGLAVLAVRPYVAAAPDSLGDYALTRAVWVNLGWGVLNLIPMLPLDGGQVMASIFEIVFGRRAMTWTRIVSIGVSLVLVGLMLLPTLLGSRMSGLDLMMPMLVGMFGWSNFRALRAERAIAEDLPLRDDLLALRSAFDRGDLPQAIARAQALLPRLQTDAVRGDVLHMLAWAYVLSREPARAKEVLAAMPRGVEADPALVAAALVDAGDLETALPHLEKSLHMGRGPVVEERLARVLVELCRFDDAVRVFSATTGRTVSPELVEKVEQAAYQAGAFEQAARLDEVLFEREGTPFHAYAAACATARAGTPDVALDWLRRSIKAGLDDAALLDGEPDLESVRRLPAYADVRAKLKLA